MKNPKYILLYIAVWLLKATGFKGGELFNSINLVVIAPHMEMEIKFDKLYTPSPMPDCSTDSFLDIQLVRDGCIKTYPISVRIRHIDTTQYVYPVRVESKRKPILRRRRDSLITYLFPFRSDNAPPYDPNKPEVIAEGANSNPIQNPFNP